MARFKIYSKDGQTLRYEGCPRYNGTYLKVSYLEFSSVASPTPIAWQVGDYVDYPRTGLRYTLRSIPAVKKTAKSGQTGNAFVYQNVRFMAQTQDLSVAPFIDLVPEDNGVHFSTQSAVSTFENAYGIAARIQACLDDLFPGVWDVEVYENLDDDFKAKISEAVDFSIDGGTCLEACDRMYETWGIGWTHYKDSATGKDVLLFGRPNTRTSENTSAEFVFGPGEGLTAIKRSVANADEIGTRLRVFGSSRNMLPGYYNNLNIYNAGSVDIQNLMIPPSKWGVTDGKPDARKAYLQASDEVVESLGLIPRTHYFDGSDGEEIYPSLEGVTIGDIRAVKVEMHDADYVPSTLIYPSDSERADEVKAVTNPEDDGYSGGSDGSKYKDTKIVSFPGLNRKEYKTSDFGQIYITIFEDVTFPEGLDSTVESGVEGYIEDSNGAITSVALRLKFGLAYPDTKVPSNLDSEVSVPVTYDESQKRYKFTLPEISAERRSPNTLSMRLFIDVKASREGVSYYVTMSAYDLVVGLLTNRAPDFTLTLKQIGFDIFLRASFTSEGLARVYMKDGMNAGRSFYVKSCSFDAAGDQWLLGMYRAEDESTGMKYPNSLYPIKPGDHFVLLDLAMPEIYIGMASQRLYEKGLEMLKDISRIKPYYEPEVDAIVMTEQSRVLREGMYMRLSDADVSGPSSEYVLIDTLTINEGDAEIPTYKVGLREYKKKTFRETAKAAIDSISQKSSGKSPGTAASASAGSYTSLSEKPSIDGTTLSGAMRSYDDLGLVNRTFFELVNLGTEENPQLAIKAKYGLFTDQFLSAKGSDPAASGSGAGGLDVTAMWAALAAGTSELINISHIPKIPASKLEDLDGVSVGAAGRLGTDTVGSGQRFIWLSNGYPMASSATAGAENQPVHLDGGTLKACPYAFGNDSSNVPVSNGTVNSSLNADLLDGWHGPALSGKSLKKSGYVYTPSELGSYWCKLAEFTWGSSVNYRDVTLYLHSRGLSAFVNIVARYNDQTIEAIRCIVTSGRGLAAGRLRLYYEEPSREGKIELWVDCQRRWGGVNAVVLSETNMSGVEDSFVTMFSGNTTEEQTLPDLPYVEAETGVLDNDMAGNASTASKVLNPLKVANDGGVESAPSKTFDGSKAVSITIPTSLPASDVHDWAKAAVKPSYSFSEIGGRPSTLSGYGITDGVNEAEVSGHLTESVSEHKLTMGVAAGYEIPSTARTALWDEICALFEVDSDGAVHVKDGRGLYSDSFVSARGSDPAAGGGVSAVPQYDLVRPKRSSSQTCHGGTVTDTTAPVAHALVVSDQSPMLRFRGAKAGDGWSVEVYVRTSGGRNSKFRRVLTAPMSECVSDEGWRSGAYESVLLPWSLMRIFFEKFDPTEGRFHSAAYDGAAVGAAWADLVANGRNGSGRVSFTSTEHRKWLSSGSGSGSGGHIRSTSTHLYVYAHFGIRLANESLGAYGDMKTFTISLRRATSGNFEDNDLSFTMRTE